MMNKKTFLFGIFCSFAALIFFLIGVTMTVYLLDTFLSGQDSVLISTILLPFSIIFMIMGVAVFNMARRTFKGPEHIEEVEEKNS